MQIQNSYTSRWQHVTLSHTSSWILKRSGFQWWAGTPAQSNWLSLNPFPTSVKDLTEIWSFSFCYPADKTDKQLQIHNLFRGGHNHERHMLEIQILIKRIKKNYSNCQVFAVFKTKICSHDCKLQSIKCIYTLYYIFFLLLAKWVTYRLFICRYSSYMK